MNTIKTHRLPASRTVLLLVDFINPLDFHGANELTPWALKAARCTSILRRRLSAEGVRTVYANDNYGQWSADFSTLCRDRQKVQGPSARIAKLLAPRRRDFALLKPRHSAFYATPLDLLLEQLQCKRLIVTGLAADSCVLFTAMDAYLRGYALWVPMDCVAAQSEGARDSALQQMARTLKADIHPTHTHRLR